MSSGDCMPYQREFASKLGHLEVLKSELVNELVESFEAKEISGFSGDLHYGENDMYSYFSIDSITKGVEPLSVIFGIDGSKQVIKGDSNPRKEVSFVKTAILVFEKDRLERIDATHPHPKELRDLLEDRAVYHATAIPLRNVFPKSMGLFDGVRNIIEQSLLDKSLEGEVYKTLLWLIFDLWSPRPKSKTVGFKCPYCDKKKAYVELKDPSSAIASCNDCSEELLVSDFLGFYMDINEDFVAETVATSYMLVHETLLMMTVIRHYWETNRDFLKKCLIIKDGGLTIPSQYSKMVDPIRRFFDYAKDTGYRICVMGQEKSGIFVDYLENISSRMDEGTILIPKNEFIKKEILTNAKQRLPYGYSTNYGSKVFVKLQNHNLVLTVPTGMFCDSPSIEDFIGLPQILATLPKIISHRYPNALLPIELANGIASLSTYPSAKILKLFSGIQ